MTRLFVDMDGVLADFDTHYFNLFGEKAGGKDHDKVDWALIRNHPDFFGTMPWMKDGKELWEFIIHHTNILPDVLTGVPHSDATQACLQKHAWARRELYGYGIIRCSLSKEKSHYMHHGDIIIDDREKYRHLWENKGGIWITHNSAKESIAELKVLLAGRGYVP